MQWSRFSVGITPTACIFLALSAIILPIDWVISWIVAVLIHEICHIVAVVCCGGRVLHIHFSYGGAAIQSDCLSLWSQLICILAGPAGGLLMILFARWFPKIAVCAVVQAVCNLFPLSTLDGGRAIRCLLRMRLSEPKVDIICTRINCITKIAICGLFLYFSCVLSWGMLSVAAGVVLIRRNRLKIPCKHALERVQ